MWGKRILLRGEAKDFTDVGYRNVYKRNIVLLRLQFMPFAQLPEFSITRTGCFDLKYVDSVLIAFGPSMIPTILAGLVKYTQSTAMTSLTPS
jgi:hypothetical protein